MPKLTIYVSDELAARVKATGLSTSPICQKALQEEVDKKMAMREATKDIEKVAQRLRETVAAEDVEARKGGHDDGVWWARQQATLSELETVVEKTFSQTWLNGPGSFIAGVIGEGATDMFDVREDERGIELWGDAWAEGFVDGAEAVLDEVGPLL